MTLCPIALAVGCKRCPALPLCPLKAVLGDHVAAPVKGPAKAKAKGKRQPARRSPRG